MTLKERARRFALSSQGAGLETLEGLFEKALRDEILDVVEELEAEAKHKEEMYSGLGMNGEDQARPFRDIARDIRKRVEI